MKGTFYILTICLPILVSGQSTDFYVDSTTTGSGNGSLGNPWKLLANINWSQISSRLAQGNVVTLNLKCGGVWTETLTVIGTGPGLLTIQPYGSGNPPEIHADNIVTGWVTNADAGSSGNWKALSPVPLTRVFTNATMCNAGFSQVALGPGQWYQATNYLFLQCDAGNPDTLGISVNGTARLRAIYCSGQANVIFNGLSVFRGNSSSVELANGSNFVFRNCQFIQGNQNLYINNSAQVNVLSCSFSTSYVNQSVNVSGPNSSFSFYYCLFEQNELSGTGINITGGAANSRLVNCTFTGTKNYHIYNASSAVNIGITNCVFSGYGDSTNSPGRDAVTSVTGLVSVANCLVMKNGKDLTKRLTGVSETGSLYGAPGYVGTRHPAIWCFTQDDSPTAADWFILADMATNYGFHATWYVNTGPLLSLSPADYAAAQLRINAGHEVGAHTTDHVDLIDLRAMNLQYIGQGSACTLTITNSTLMTTVTDGPGGEDLNLPLTSPSYPSMSQLAFYLNSLTSYRSTNVSPNGWNLGVPPWLLTNVAGVDIKTAPYTNYFDHDPFLHYEIDTNVAILNSQFTNYTVRSFAYPNGQFNLDVENWVMNLGILGARLATLIPFGSYRLANANVYQIAACTDVTTIIEAMQFENNASDSSGLNNKFTPQNLSYTNYAYRGVFSASFDGSSSYLFRTNDPHFDFSGGDWNVAAYCSPKGTGTRTIYSQGTDANNRCALYIDGSGAVHFDAFSGGSQIIGLATANNTVTNGGWQYVDVAQEFNRLLLRVNHRINTTTNTTARPATYSGTLYIGCDYDFNGASPTNYYQGLMDNFVASRGIYFNTLSVCDLLSEEGGIGALYHHGEIATPRSADAIVMDAVKDYMNLNTNFMEMTFADALQYVRTNGVVQADGLTYQGAIPDTSNYMPAPNSILRGSANIAAITGVTNLTDLNGVQITDGNGVPVLTGYAIGAYESASPAPLTFHAWLQQYGLPGDGSADFLDSDGDGMNNYQEWIAGTNPTNALSNLQILAATNSPDGFVLTWESVTNRTYFLELSADLTAQPSFFLIVTNIPGQDGTTTYTDTNAVGDGPFFYRVGVAH